MESPSKLQPPVHQELEGLVNVSREEWPQFHLFTILAAQKGSKK